MTHKGLDKSFTFLPITFYKSMKLSNHVSQASFQAPTTETLLEAYCVEVQCWFQVVRRKGLPQVNTSPQRKFEMAPQSRD